MFDAASMIATATTIAVATTHSLRPVIIPPGQNLLSQWRIGAFSRVQHLDHSMAAFGLAQCQSLHPGGRPCWPAAGYPSANVGRVKQQDAAYLLNSVRV